MVLYWYTHCNNENRSTHPDSPCPISLPCCVIGNYVNSSNPTNMKKNGPDRYRYCSNDKRSILPPLHICFSWFVIGNDTNASSPTTMQKNGAIYLGTDVALIKL